MKLVGPAPSASIDAVRKADLDAATAPTALYRIETAETFTVATGRGLFFIDESILDGRLILAGRARVV